MILVAALASSFAMARIEAGSSGKLNPPWIIALIYAITTWLALTPATLVLLLVSPRPRLRRLIRQPGFVAILAGSTTLLLAILAVAIIAVIRSIKSGMVTNSGRPALTPYPDWWMDVVFYFVGIMGLAVIAAWLLLSLSGLRRPQHHWLDYLGRVMGVGWIILFVANCCSHLSRTID